MRKMSISSLRPGFVLAKPVYGPNGQLWLNSGVELKSTYIASLWRTGISFVYIFDPLLADIAITDAVSDETRNQAVRIIKDVLSSANNSNGRNLLVVDNRFAAIANKLVEEVLAHKEVIVNLSDIRDADDYTFYHSVNVCILSLMSGAELGLSKAKMENLAKGALLHDMGKIWVDENILKKKGSLSQDEFEEIKKHPSFGYEILSCQKNIPQDSAKIVIQHHERCDGTGYPFKLQTEDIHQFSKLVMIADVYDALTSDRPYRSSMLPHQAVEIIMSSVGPFEQEMVQNFLKYITAYPTGTAVRLSSGDLGIVTDNHKGMPMYPIVRVCKDGEGVFYHNPYDINLLEKINITIVDVLTEAEREKEMPVSLTMKDTVV